MGRFPLRGLLVAVGVIALVVFVATQSSHRSSHETKSYSTFQQQLDNGQIQAIRIRNTELQVTPKSGNPYNLHLNLASGQGLIDWYPTLSSFRITAGVIIGDNYIDAAAKSASTYNLNGTTYTAAQVGTLTGRFDANTAAPYLGIGFGNPVYGSKRLGVTLDLGVAYQGKPNVALSSTGGTLSGDPTLQANLAGEAADLRNGLTAYRFYPVVQLGLSYKF